MRPYSLLGLFIGIAAVMAIMGGSIGALLCLVLLKIPGHVGKGVGSSAATDTSGGGGSMGDLLSLETTPRELRSSSDEESDSGHPDHPSISGRDEHFNQVERSTSPRQLRPWEVTLKQLPVPSSHEDSSKQVGLQKGAFTDDKDSAMSTGARLGYGNLIARDNASGHANRQ